MSVCEEGYVSNADRDIPDMLEELCSHSECPEWLRDGIWDLVNDAANRGGRTIRFDAEHWRHELQYTDNGPALDRADAFVTAWL
jgi:hypothetical protein